jgi:hypothetical protein
MSEQRITLIVRDNQQPSMDWNYDRCRREGVGFLESMNALAYALEAAVYDIGLDIERLIIDRCAAAEDFLGLLANLPAELSGDIIFIRHDGSGFLSATGRGGDRLLYALAAEDIRFYLEAYDLVTARVALRMSA